MGTSQRRARDGGFAFIEILCVMLVIALLTAIALPAFINQREKGEDTEATRMIGTAVTTLASQEVEASTYDLTAAELAEEEPSLAESEDLVVSGTEQTYTISERSRSGTRFTLTRGADAVTVRTCSRPGKGLCRSRPDAAGNRW